MFRSFTFRIGAAIFLLLLTLLICLRFFSYLRTVQSEQQNIRQIILAHDEEIEHGVDRNGVRYATYLVDALTNEPDDRHLLLAMKSGGVVHGNLKAWPVELADAKPGWYEQGVTFDHSLKPVNALLYLKRMKGGQSLIVGYDLVRLEQMKQALVEALIRDVWLSVFSALCLTLFILYLISRHLEKVNDAYRHVMAGEIDFRVKAESSQDEFAQLGRNFNEMMDWVSSLISTLKDSTNSIAHDLRTPLARIRLRLQQLEQREDLQDAQRDALLECIEDIDHLTDIFNGILRIAKAEDLSIARQFEPIDLNAMVHELAEFYAAYLEGENQGILLEAPSETHYVMGERQLLSQALANLISNASKFSPGQHDIEITLQPSPVQKGMLEIIIADRGPGIPAEFREKVKERFFRLDQSRNTPGTGLGLNLCDAVVRLHKGKLMLEDNDPGLKSIVLLPEHFGARVTAA
ncbi:MAG: HAMP domain-containing sensor histidine kinase [Micavibrio sp.]|nr:HAMP domain-containing sensor histidine kinase [Micavibrio sp.]